MQDMAILLSKEFKPMGISINMSFTTLVTQSLLTGFTLTLQAKGSLIEYLHFVIKTYIQINYTEVIISFVFNFLFL